MMMNSRCYVNNLENNEFEYFFASKLGIRICVENRPIYLFIHTRKETVFFTRSKNISIEFGYATQRTKGAAVRAERSLDDFSINWLAKSYAFKSLRSQIFTN